MGAGLCALIFLGIRTVARSEIWMHLVTGRQVLESGIPRADTWSFALAPETTWVADGWLYDVVLHLLWAIGPAVTILTHVAVVAIAFILLSYAVRPHVSGPALALGMCLGGWMLAPVFEVGPHALATIFPALFVFMLARDTRPAVRWSVLLVAQAVWTNIHLTFILGPIIVAVFAFAASRRQPNDDDGAATGAMPAMQIVYLAVACLAVSLLNPSGPGLHVKLVWLMLHPDAYIQSREWLSLFSGQFGSSLFKNLNTLALAVGAGGLVTYRGRLPLALTILALMGAATSMIAPLQVQLFAILALPFLCISFNAIGVFIRELVKGPLADQNGQGRRIAAGLVAVIVLVTVLLAVTHQFYRIVGSDSGFGLGLSTASLPAHIDQVIEHPAFPERAYHIAQDGSYLRWRYPERAVYVDQRTGLYRDGQSQTLLRAIAGDKEAWARLDKDWPADAVILNATWPGCGGALVNLLADGAWRLVYFDGTTPVLVRNQPAYEDLFSDTDLQQAGLDLLDDEIARYRQEAAGFRGAPINGRLVGAATIYFHLNRYKKAYAAYDLLLSNAPAMKVGWFYLGVVQLRNGDTGEAVTSLERYRQLEPRKPHAWLWLSRAYAAADRPVEAARAYAKASKLSPEQAGSFGDPTQEGKEPIESDDED